MLRTAFAITFVSDRSFLFLFFSFFLSLYPKEIYVLLERSEKKKKKKKKKNSCEEGKKKRQFLEEKCAEVKKKEREKRKKTISTDNGFRDNETFSSLISAARKVADKWELNIRGRER